MKHRLTLIVIAVIALGIGIAVAVGNSGSDPMISLSYWENTYLPTLCEDLAKRAEVDTKGVYTAAADKLAAAGEADVKAAQGQQGGFTFAELKAGNALQLKSGSSAIVQSGAAWLSDGTLADVTLGTQVSAGEELCLAHRYVVTSASATLQHAQSGSVAYQGAGTVVEGSGGGATTPSSPGTPAAGELPFADVPEGAWYRDAVAFVYEKGYFSGVSATSFEPGKPMNRAMVATVLHRVAGGRKVSEPQTYTDVPAGQWYSQGIAWASENGVVNGMGNGCYEPNTPVSREQLVTMLYRFEKDYRKASVAGAVSLDGFADAAKVAPWAQDAMRWAVGVGLIQGRDASHLDPAGTATRAEVATILQRFAARL